MTTNAEEGETAEGMTDAVNEDTTEGLVNADEEGATEGMPDAVENASADATVAGDTTDRLVRCYRGGYSRRHDR